MKLYCTIAAAIAVTLLVCGPTGTLAQCGSYTVQSGDTFDNIAAARGVSSSALQSANAGVSATGLRVGQQLSLPCSSTTSPSTPSTTSSSGSSGSSVTISASEFSQALTACGFTAVADSVRTAMLTSIDKLGGSSVISSRRELAMFLAQLYQESGGLQLTSETNGASQSYAPYFGRGYIQLTNKANYAAASSAIYGDDRLVQTPDLAKVSPASWDVSTWFWKANVHSVVQDGKFGAATKVINGPLECSGGPNDKAKQRCTYYGKVLPILVSGASPDCSGCS